MPNGLSSIFTSSYNKILKIVPFVFPLVNNTFCRVRNVLRSLRREQHILHFIVPFSLTNISSENETNDLYFSTTSERTKTKVLRYLRISAHH